MADPREPTVETQGICPACDSPVRIERRSNGWYLHHAGACVYGQVTTSSEDWGKQPWSGGSLCVGPISSEEAAKSLWDWVQYKGEEKMWRGNEVEREMNASFAVDAILEGAQRALCGRHYSG